MTSQVKDTKPIQLNSIISVVKHDVEDGNNSHSKMEVKSIVKVASNGSKKVKGHESKNPSKVSKLSTEKPILLRPFGHQVSGRASILCYDETTLLKPYVSRELFFYQSVPQELKKFTPQFRGLITVSFIEESRSGTMLAYALPHTLVKPNAKSIVNLFTEEPKPHSKRCVKDFGKTHVIYPAEKNSGTDTPDTADDMFVASGDYDITMTNCLNNNEPDEDDVVSELSQGFEINVSITDRKPPIPDSELKPTTGLQNPWNSKVLDDAWLKLKCNEADQPSSGRKKRFTLLENVVARYRRPCVLDLKIGTRVRENASPEKIARHVTAINLGARLSGMQIYHPDKEQFSFHNKYYGHNLTVSGFKSNLRHFFSRGSIPIKSSPEQNGSKSPKDDSATGDKSRSRIDRSLVRQAVKKLKKLRDAVSGLQSHRFYSSSVLLLYEGDDDDTKDSDEDCEETMEGCDDPVIRHAPDSGQETRQTDTGIGHRSFSFSEFLHRLKSSQNKHRAKLHRLSSDDRHHESSHHFHGEKRSAHEKQSKESRSRVHDTHREKQGSYKGHNYRNSWKQHEKVGKRNENDADFPTSRFQNKSWPRSAQDQSEMRGEVHRRKEGSSPHREDLKRRHGEVSVDKDESVIDVRMIDFAHYCFHDNEMHPGPDGGFLFGLDNLIKLLNNMLRT